MSILIIQDGVLKYFNERLPKRLGFSAEEIKNWKPYNQKFNLNQQNHAVSIRSFDFYHD